MKEKSDNAKNKQEILLTAEDQEYYNFRQFKLVEFSEQVYHEGLRHTGINGSLYEDCLIRFLRKDIPEFEFYKGQIKVANNNSKTDKQRQIDVMICKKGTGQKKFLQEVSDIINIVEPSECIGIIELKKWAHPDMIRINGDIYNAHIEFKERYDKIPYFFVCLRFKDRKRKKEANWTELSKPLITDGNFCFCGNTAKKDQDKFPPWSSEVIDKHRAYWGEYEQLVSTIKKLNLVQ